MKLLPKSRFEQLMIIAGLLVILFASTFNARTFETFFGIENLFCSTKRKFVFTLFRLGIISIGIWLIWKRPRFNWYKIFAVTFSSLFGLFACILYLELVYEPPKIISGWRGPDWVSKMERNQLDYRGHNIEYDDDDFVVLLVGDSQVQACACSYAWMPEMRLQHHLENITGRKVKVFSIGASNYGQDQQFLATKEYFDKYRADLVLNWFIFANDVWNNMFPTAIGFDTGAPKPTFWLENGKLCGPSEMIGEEIRRSSSNTIELSLRLFKPMRRDSEWDTHILPEPYDPMDSYDGKAEYWLQELWNKNTSTIRQERFDKDKHHWVLHLKPPSPRIEYGIKLTRTLLDRIRGLAENNGAEMGIFCTRPVKTARSDNEYMIAMHNKYFHYSNKQLRKNIEDIFHGFPSKQIEIQLKDWFVGPEDKHLNEHAVDEVMESLGYWANQTFQLTPNH